jgi:dCTP deaminase
VRRKLIVIEKGLEQLSEQYEICDKILVDNFSLKIQLGENYYAPKSQSQTVVYGAHPVPKEIFSEKITARQNLKLKPGAQVIASSKHIYKIPSDYFALLQTKGTLARLFVQVTCNDGQVEPGFNGYITLEIVNLSPWEVEIPIGSDIAQLYLMKCSSPAKNPYNGRYSKMALQGPTIPIYK